MILDFPHYFEVTGRKLGKSGARTYGFVEYAREEIRDVAPADAPVAARWSQPANLLGVEHLMMESNQGISDPDGYQMTRWYEGRHWKRLLVGDVAGIFWDEREGLPALNKELLTRYLRGADAYTALGIWCDHSKAAKATQTVNGAIGEFDTVRNTNKQQRDDQIECQLARCIAVDGEVYRACLEPFLYLRQEIRPQTNVYEISVETSPQVITPLGYRPRKAGAVIPLTDFDGATGLASRNPAIRSAHAGWFASIKPEIFVEEAFTTDWKTHLELGTLLGVFHKFHMPDGADRQVVRNVLHFGIPEERVALLDELASRIEEFHQAGWDTSVLRQACELMIDRDIVDPLPDYRPLTPNG